MQRYDFFFNYREIYICAKKNTNINSLKINIFKANKKYLT